MKSIFRAMDGPTFACFVLVLCASAASLSAQETGEPAIMEETAAPCVAPAPRVITLAKMTPVYLSIDATLDSKLSTSGETFPITVTEPVMQNGEEVIPVGTTGMGEVIHAKKAGGSGAAGELILTASYIELGEQRIPLRSMKLGLKGSDQTGLALVTGPVGFLVRGKNVEVAEGSFAGAKLAQDTEIKRAGDPAAQECIVEEGLKGTPNEND